MRNGTNESRSIDYCNQELVKLARSSRFTCTSDYRSDAADLLPEGRFGGLRECWHGKEGKRVSRKRFTPIRSYLISVSLAKIQ